MAGEGARGRAAGKRDLGICPVKFRVVGFQPVGAEDDIVGCQGGDIEFGAFLVILVVRRGDS